MPLKKQGAKIEKYVGILFYLLKNLLMSMRRSTVNGLRFNKNRRSITDQNCPFISLI